MKNVLIFFFALWPLGVDASAQGVAVPASTPYGGVVQNCILAWSDEFDGSTLDTSKWDYRTDSKHWSAQLPANVSVSDGTLKREKASGKEYTGGGIISKTMFQYGYSKMIHARVTPVGNYR